MCSARSDGCKLSRRLRASPSGCARPAIEGLNLDLMYGLPYQTEATIAATIARALELEPDRIAFFGYAHVPWMKRHQKLIPEQALPGYRAALRAKPRRRGDVSPARAMCRSGSIISPRPDDPLARRQRAGRLRRNFQGLYHR